MLFIDGFCLDLLTFVLVQGFTGRSHFGSKRSGAKGYGS